MSRQAHAPSAALTRTGFRAVELNPDTGPPYVANAIDTGPPRHAIDTGPPRHAIDTGPPRHAIDTGPPRHGMPLPGQRWQGWNPEWAFNGEQALLAQGLRRSRLQILEPSDPAALKTRSKGAKGGSGPRLLRWAREPRVKAVVAALGSCLWVEDSVLRVSCRAAVLGGACTAATLSLDTSGCDPAYWERQTDKVLRASIELEDRLPEILTQADSFWAYFENLLGLDFVRLPRTSELLQIAWEWSTQLLMALKHDIGQQRPHQLSGLVLPAIAVPGHGSLPSGHATTAHLCAALLCALLALPGEAAARVTRLADRIAFNRVVAGVHFPVDGDVGRHLGEHLAAWLQALAGQATSPAPCTLLLKGAAGKVEARTNVKLKAPAHKVLGIWETVWDEAKHELEARHG